MRPRFNFRLAGGLLALTLLAIVIFRTAKEISVASYIAVTVIYSLVTLVTALWYISLNRGLMGVRITPELLPKEWSEEQKNAFIADCQRRREKSKKLLIILIPMIATFFFEAIDIYFLRGLIERFTK